MIQYSNVFNTTKSLLLFVIQLDNHSTGVPVLY